MREDDDSLRGYYQILCKNGHLDFLFHQIYEEVEWTCPTCGAREAWKNLVYDDNGSRVELTPVRTDNGSEVVYEIPGGGSWIRKTLGMMSRMVKAGKRKNI